MNKRSIDETLSHEMYLWCYENEAEFTGEITSIKTKHHEVYTLSEKKKFLSLFDNKRFWCDKNNSIPLAHEENHEPVCKKQKITHPTNLPITE